jgi:hypothetical protein
MIEKFFVWDPQHKRFVFEAPEEQWKREAIAILFDLVIEGKAGMAFDLAIGELIFWWGNESTEERATRILADLVNQWKSSRPG